jgi:ferredoxin
VTRRRNRQGVARYRLSVDNDRCRRYGTCEAEAPGLFQLMATGQLFYQRAVNEDQLEQAKAATRCCPMLAILLEEK